MTVTGAARIFGALVGAARAASLLLPSALLTQTKRAGQQFPEVGPNFNRSYSSRSCCSVTACSVHALRVRAVRNNRSRARSSSLSVMLFSTVRSPHCVVFYRAIHRRECRLTTATPCCKAQTQLRVRESGSIYLGQSTN